jgi:hypothetical protein
MEKITRDNISMHLIEFQLKMIGKTISDIKDDEEWYHNNTFTVEQLTDFNVYAFPLIKKTYRCNTKRARTILDWFNLAYGLRIVPTRDERIDIVKKLESENNTTTQKS